MTWVQMPLFEVPCAVATCKRFAEIGLVCAPCYALSIDRLIEIPDLFARLDANPGPPIESVPQKPSFESKSPANDHHIALRDPRTIDGPIATMAMFGLSVFGPPDMHLVEKHVQMSYVNHFFEAIAKVWRELALAVGEIVLERPVGICECGSMLFWRERVVCDRCGNSYSEIAHIALRRAVLTYALRNAPFWKKLVAQSK